MKDCFGNYGCYDCTMKPFGDYERKGYIFLNCVNINACIKETERVKQVPSKIFLDKFRFKE